MTKLYAQLNDDNLVVNVAVFDDDTEPDNLGEWIETGEGLHNKIANAGDQYLPQADGYDNGLFHQSTPPEGYETWVLNSNYEWEPPPDQPYPEGFGEPPSTWWWDPVIQQWDHKAPAPEKENA